MTSRSTLSLTASAFVIAALVLFQTGRRLDSGHMTPEQAAFAFAAPFGGDSSARAGGMVSQIGGYTVLTSEVGNEDLLLVLDSRNEQLFVYRPDNQNSIQLLQRLEVGPMFTQTRTRSQGKP
jgi:hypothetical protein